MTSSLRERIDYWLFSPVDARWLAWLRLLVAVTYPFFFLSAAAELGDRAPDSVVFVYDAILASDFYKPLVLVVCMLLAFGIRTRLVGCILLFLLFPLMYGPAGNLSRQILLLALLFFTLLPAGTVRFPWSSSTRGKLIEAGPCWPIRLIQLLLTAVYGINAVAKTKLSYLRGDTLMDMSVSYPNFLADLSSGYWTLGFILIPVSIAATSSVICEYLIAFGLWSRRWKWIVAILGIVFHCVLTMIVEIFMLNIASIFLYLVFLLPLIRQDAETAASIKA